VAPVQAVSYGGFWIRFLAVVIDSLILSVVQGILQLAFLGSFMHIPNITPGTPPQEFLGPFMAAMGMAWSISILVGGSYESLFVYKFGATPGKMALGLKVVRPNGGPIDLPRAVGRYFAKILSGIILLIGYIMAGFDGEKRALHDMICDTRVVRIRS
jgi:uncharacterized RDD family membrane protein YckC